MRKYTLLILALTGTIALSGCSIAAGQPVPPATPPASTATAQAPTLAAEPPAAPTTTSAASATPSATATVETAPVHADLPPAAVADLSAEEAAGLLLMREEEKLARDVYLFLFDKWGQKTFQNIAASEQTHTDAVQTLLDRYGLSDPTAGKAEGEFTDPALQALYDDLILQGSQSLADALRVGALVEEVDIIDLREEKALTDRADILLVYDNLEKGSNNHLRAFTSVLQRQGENYTPQRLSEADYQAIISAR